MADIEDLVLKPCVTLYGPYHVRGLEPGKTKLWCTCGLSKESPWCDRKSHAGTGFKPLKWKIPGTLKDGKPVSGYSICGCKYTTAPPLCDGLHIHLPLMYKRQMEECSQNHWWVENKPMKKERPRMCTRCGWRPGHDSIYGLQRGDKDKPVDGNAVEAGLVTIDGDDDSDLSSSDYDSDSDADLDNSDTEEHDAKVNGGAKTMCCNGNNHEDTPERAIEKLTL